MNTYHVYSGGSKDADGNYVGGTLEGTFTSEREAFFFEKDLQWKHKPDLVYMRREGDEVFMIVESNDPDYPYHVVDKRTQSYLYGGGCTLEEAVASKEWCEKYHTLGGKWMDDYYKQFEFAA